MLELAQPELVRRSKLNLPLQLVQVIHSRVGQRQVMALVSSAEPLASLTRTTKQMTSPSTRSGQPSQLASHMPKVRARLALMQQMAVQHPLEQPSSQPLLRALDLPSLVGLMELQYLQHHIQRQILKCQPSTPSDLQM